MEYPEIDLTMLGIAERLLRRQRFDKVRVIVKCIEALKNPLYIMSIAEIILMISRKEDPGVVARFEPIIPSLIQVLSRKVNYFADILNLPFTAFAMKNWKVNGAKIRKDLQSNILSFLPQYPPKRLRVSWNLPAQEW